MRVGRGEMVALVGPNGAGKSTLVNALSRVVPPASGRIGVEGRLAHVPEGRQLFGDLTVDDNLKLGAWTVRERDTSWVYELFPELLRMRRLRAGNLSGGEQQMVALGRGLMARPDVLAIDELSLGLAPKVVTSLTRHLSHLHAERGLAVLLIEQNVRLALALCSRAYVLEAGRIVAEGASAALAGDASLASAYLGGPAGGPE
ncbi:MAG: ATP-binding cassette domain-containing protein [Myxococcales bacterium]|nr:ATP-binding cassette domain-containing protein [Myxococcales bacterium]